MLNRKKRSLRKQSNVFTIFDQKQITELKEAFSIFDHDADGFVDKEDLKDVLNSLGMDTNEEYIEGMLKEAPGPINFTMFLTMMGEKLSLMDSEHEIYTALQAFDVDKSGMIKAGELQEALMHLGSRLSRQQVENLFADVPIDENGMFKYSKLVDILKNLE
ncbi:Myosin regulatory light polypeptide 9 [Zancudomyces culisetae]|uniref:Myosin regulatory light polypeptide 9 n=1 Tax=Zancudomyces culisetae TaxID=1213189 RepID=A0A1R1PEZ1_ZANCU|nr:Myosin regulatory light polypeptide 9 [Zancudomyces culisetae]OMH81760.1 Myosin regulatory light polypeptide 9 [Zancudomyces culisetae]|eukprot:OMH79544.1 Myosin regulatory light polypeptide 9 [Zancudomyces culisetae]